MPPPAPKGGAALGAPCVFAARAAGGAAALQALVAYCLKDAADRGLLGVAAFRCVRVGFAARSGSRAAG
jgi:hypothetical protein